MLKWFRNLSILDFGFSVSMGQFLPWFHCENEVLTSNSGGVRALIQLVILRLIEKRMGLGIPIQEFFDLMVGTR